MAKKTPPYIHYNKWTTARFFSFLSSALRSAWSKYPVKYEALKLAEVGKEINKLSGRPAKHYECNECKRHFVAKQVAVDHIIQVGTLRQFSDVSDVCERLFCGIDDLQVLCNYKGTIDGLEACHKIKTREERKK